jgi:carbon storage regulator
MLVLSRKKNESIVINGDIRIEVLQIKGKQIRLGITAPSSMKVLRGELPANDASNLPVGRPDQTTTQILECNLDCLSSALMTA